MSAPIDVNIILEAANVYQLTEKYDIQIRGKDGQGESGSVFGDSAKWNFQSEFKFKQAIQLPYGSWVIQAYPKGIPRTQEAFGS